MKSHVILSLIVVPVALAVGGYWLVKAGRQTAAVEAHVPPLPATSTLPAAFGDALALADTRARSRGDARDGLRQLATLYHANGFFDHAIHCYQGLETLEPLEPRWPHRHASILAGFGRADEALALWDSVVDLAPDYLPARLRIGDVALKSNDLARATSAYEAAHQLDQGNPYALLGLARIDLESGREDDARRKLERVVRRSNFTLGYDLIVTLYENAGMDSQALAVRSQKENSGAYRDPPDPWLDSLIEQCYDPYRLALEAGNRAQAGETDFAISLLQRALELDPSDVSARYQLGDLYLLQQQLPQAAAEFRRCTVLNPGFADGWGKLSAVIAQSGNVPEAERIIGLGLEAIPDSPSLHRMRARRHWAKGDVGAAITDFRTSIRLRPNEPGAYVELAMVLTQQGRTAEAARQLETALVYDPANPTALAGLAFQAIEAGDRARADAWLGKNVSVPRADPNQMNQLREAYRQKFGEPPRN